MRIGNTKLVLYDFIAFEYKGLELYLNRMALKGWKLKSIKTGGILKFKKIEPKNIKYVVDIVDEISLLDGKNSDYALEYREYCAEAGWEFVCERNKLQIYCAEEYKENIEIQTDEEIKFESIYKVSLKYILITLIAPIILFINQYITIKIDEDALFLASNMDMILMALMVVMFIEGGANLTKFIIWYRKGSNALKNGKRVSYGNPLLLRTKVIESEILRPMGLIIFAGLIFFGNLNNKIALYVMVGNTIIFLLSIIIFNKVMDNKITKKKKIIIGTASITMPITIFLITVVYIIFNGNIDSNKFNNVNTPLILSDFTNKSSKAYYLDILIGKNKVIQIRNINEKFAEEEFLNMVYEKGLKELSI